MYNIGATLYKIIFVIITID